MLNALFVLIVFLLQLNKDLLHIKWPLGVKTNITYDESSQEVIREVAQRVTIQKGQDLRVTRVDKSPFLVILESWPLAVDIDCFVFCAVLQARIAEDLKELRNKSVFAFVMFNALFILIVFLLQLNKDQLHVEWPLGIKTNITYIEETGEVQLLAAGYTIDCSTTFL